jgi:hypothetical protein
MGWLDASDQPSEAQEAAGSMVAFRRWRSGGGDQGWRSGTAAEAADNEKNSVIVVSGMNSVSAMDQPSQMPTGAIQIGISRR